MSTVIMMKKWEANLVHGGLTTTTKMPSKSYSTPTALCVTGYKMAQIEGSVCFDCYAKKGHYHMYANNIEPAQHARYEAMLYDPHWVDAMVTSIMDDLYFRWFDSGDLPSLLLLSASSRSVCVRLPRCIGYPPASTAWSRRISPSTAGLAYRTT
jgi:hypothetical protein